MKAYHNLSPSATYEVRKNLYSSLTWITLYATPPAKYNETIRLVADYERDPRHMPSGTIQVNLACAYGQKMKALKADAIRSSLFSVGDFIDLPSFVAKLRTQDPRTQDSISKYLWNQFSASTQGVLTSATSTPEEQKLALVQALDNILKGVLIYETVRFAGVALSPETLALRSQNPQGTDLIRLNRLLLEDAYPLEIAKSPGLTSSCSIAITRDDRQAIRENSFQLRPIRKSMPAGLWGKPNLTEDKKHLKLPNLNGAPSAEDMLAGFEVRPTEKDQEAQSRRIDRKDLQYTTELVEDAYDWQDFSLSGQPGQPAWTKAAATAAGKRKERAQLIEALGLVNAVIDFGEPVDEDTSLAA
jgi:hypothetical protein